MCLPLHGKPIYEDIEKLTFDLVEYGILLHTAVYIDRWIRNLNLNKVANHH